MMKPGARNLITDVAGLRVGNASDDKLKSGVTALISDVENVASVHVMGGAPGTRETDLLAPENSVQSVDALVLSGGSAFGLDACGGVQSFLRTQGKGFAVADQIVPIVPGAILFDLINGGDKAWGDHSPYRELGQLAAQNASYEFDLGSQGAGTGALVGGPGIGLKGGLGSASTILPNGVTIGALVAVNALGAPTVGEGANFWAVPFEMGDEFGGLGPSQADADEAQALRIKFRDTQAQGSNTTIAIIATDAALTKGEAKRMAIAAHDGFARALWPAHTPMDGDLVFALATGAKGPLDSIDDQITFSATAASTMARAIARGIFHAQSREGDIFPTWHKAFKR
ncbi:P1 family peptidase [Pseudahrensia aquimaris]|uniref:P1 family peptidase n=1 Tax=Pseudahrensia aquimaris TaxID=744461 RepID=A0ABW3FKL4_9HYPH